MNKRTRLTIIAYASIVTLSGCQQQLPKEQETVQQSTSSIEANIIPVTEQLKVETYSLEGQSAEGGTITRYLDENGNITRYKIKLYGETGRSETDYVFVDDIIYYFKLIEEYNAPIYVENSNVTYQYFEKGMIKEGRYYQYNETNKEFQPVENIEIPYQSQEDLNTLFKAAKKDNSQNKVTDTTYPQKSEQVAGAGEGVAGIAMGAV